MTRTSRLVLSLVLACGLATAGLAQETASQDETITQSVKAMIAEKPALKAHQITVETHQGVVYLHGKVDTQVEQKDLESLAMQTTGVKKVVNNTTVKKSEGS